MAHVRWAQAEAEHIARFRSKFHIQRTDFEKALRRDHTRANTLFGQVASSANSLIGLRDQYRRTQDRQALVDAKELISSLPTYVLEDDPKLASTLKIVRASAAFGFDPLRERALVSVLDLVRRSAYAVDASRAIQFLSVLQTFRPRPDENIKSIMDNVADGIRVGSNYLLVHEVATFLSALTKLDRTLPQQQRARFVHKPLLDSLTRHLVTYHPTAPINDVCRATAFLTRVDSAHGRVVLHEIQSRLKTEAVNLSVPPVAALDIISAVGRLEPEDPVRSPAVVFPRNFELDADAAAPPSLGLSSRPVARRGMLSLACDTLNTHVSLLNADDVADAFVSLRQANHQHEVLVDRLASRAMQLVESTGLFSMIRILEGVNHFRVRGCSLLFEQYASRICRGRALPQQAQATNNSNALSFHNCVALLTAYSDAGEDHHTQLFNTILDTIARMQSFAQKHQPGGGRVTDAQLVRAMELLGPDRLRLYESARGVRALAKIVHELFVLRGGLSDGAPDLIRITERVVEAMLPEAERNPSLLEAIGPLVSE